MQITRVPASNGRRWVFDGFRILRRQPGPLLVLTFLYLLLVLVSSAIPAVGPVVVLLVTPGLLVGAMAAVRAAERGEIGQKRGLAEGFREAAHAARPLAMLGLVNVGAALFAYLVASVVTEDPMMQFAVTQMLYAPVQLPLWYAPMFVAWHRIAPGKAMFFSVVAVARNKGAFAQYVLTWAGLAMLASVGVQLLVVTFGIAPALILVIFLPLSLLMPTAVYCSFWPTYRDVVLPD